jgi:hypothetical protein
MHATELTLKKEWMHPDCIYPPHPPTAHHMPWSAFKLWDPSPQPRRCPVSINIKNLSPGMIHKKQKVLEAKGLDSSNAKDTAKESQFAAQGQCHLQSLCASHPSLLCPWFCWPALPSSFQSLPFLLEPGPHNVDIGGFCVNIFYLPNCSNGRGQTVM